MSFMYIRNNNGPQTESWGTPLFTLIQSELAPEIP
jgi:hypothetical protein